MKLLREPDGYYSFPIVLGMLFSPDRKRHIMGYTPYTIVADDDPRWLPPGHGCVCCDPPIRAMPGAYEMPTTAQR